MLSTDDRRRYARHLLLAELGETGQQRLCAARVWLPDAADARAAAVARDYLERAGLTVVSGDEARANAERVEALASAADVARLAGDPLLEDVAADLAGAFAAVEAIKAAAGVGAHAQLPESYSLAEGPTKEQS